MQALEHNPRHQLAKEDRFLVEDATAGPTTRRQLVVLLIPVSVDARDLLVESHSKASTIVVQAILQSLQATR